jgi:hypothetical protein
VGGAIGIDAANAQAPSDPGTLSSGFWNDWTALKSNEQFKTLQGAVDCGCSGDTSKTSKPIAAPANVQRPSVYNIAIDTPDQAAKFLTNAAQTSKGTDTDRALATVIQMRVSPQTLAAASPMVPADVKARVATMTANLTTGIPGLPGIYLGNNAGSKSSAPAGFTPVAGGSMGCRSR